MRAQLRMGNPALGIWRARRESNARPMASEAITLSPELRARGSKLYTARLGRPRRRKKRVDQLHRLCDRRCVLQVFPDARSQHAVGAEALDQLCERLPEPVGGAQDHGLRLQAEIVEREHFDELVQRTDAAGDRNEEIGRFGHLLLALGESFDDHQRAEVGCRVLRAHEVPRHDAEHLAARRHRRACGDAHQAAAAAAVHQAQAVRRAGRAELGGELLGRGRQTLFRRAEQAHRAGHRSRVRGMTSSEVRSAKPMSSASAESISRSTTRGSIISRAGIVGLREYRCRRYNARFSTLAKGSAMSGNSHDSPIKTPKQLVTVLVLAFVVPIILIVLLSQLATSGRIFDKDSPAMSPEEIAKRIRPVADARVGAGGPGGKALKTGEQIYQTVCTACHSTGIAKAPKFGDKRDWGPRIRAGQKALVQVALKGEGAMPPRGGASDLSDVEVERAVVYMANAGGAKFKEPAAPATIPTAVAASAPASKAVADGKKVYESTCIACHGAGVANAPKFGDKKAWAAHLMHGTEHLYENALKGLGAMPPRGGNLTLSDAEVKAAVDYMVKAVK